MYPPESVAYECRFTEEEILFTVLTVEPIVAVRTDTVWLVVACIDQAVSTIQAIVVETAISTLGAILTCAPVDTCTYIRLVFIV